jgi:hypothetical protein
VDKFLDFLKFQCVEVILEGFPGGFGRFCAFFNPAVLGVDIGVQSRHPLQVLLALLGVVSCGFQVPPDPVLFGHKETAAAFHIRTCFGGIIGLPFQFNRLLEPGPYRRGNLLIRRVTYQGIKPQSGQTDPFIKGTFFTDNKFQFPVCRQFPDKPVDCRSLFGKG